MIYTVTFNPAIDYVVHTDDMKTGSVNRSSKEEIYFGGKGINVSWVLSELGIKSKALGFVAGFTGKAIEDGIKAKGIETDFVHLEKGFSRINVKIKSSEETELNGQGPVITDEAIKEALKGVSKAVGIQKLVEALHKDIKDTIAFGDGRNDLEMLETVGTGVAMDNAVPEAKAVADEICPDVNDDGITTWLKERDFI